MRRYIIYLILVFVLGACAHGPVYTAKSEKEAIKENYQDTKLQELYSQNQNHLKEIYIRFIALKVDMYKEGLGFTDFTNERNIKSYYYMVKVKPQEIAYKESNSKPDGRLSEVIQKYTPKYFKYLRKSDFDIKSIEGITFGVYWAVRDVCDTYGGYIEYIEFHTPKQFVNEFLDEKISFQEMLLNTEVITSTNKGQPINIKPVFQPSVYNP